MNNLNQKLKFIEMRANGDSLSSIAKDLGVSVKTCSNWNKEMQSKITAERQKRMEEACEVYSMQKEDRIRRMANLLHRLDNEVANRDLSSVSTENLLKLRLRFENELSKEAIYATPVELTEGTHKEVLQAMMNLCTDIGNGNVKGVQAKLQLESLKALTSVIDKESSIW